MTGAEAPPLSDLDAAPEPRVHADPLIGMTVTDRYKILGPLGSGGMGVVYKVEHVRIGKLMAMKLLAGELSRDPGLVKRFKREALLASRLSHPNTVQVFDFGQADGLTYLVMELVAGEDLARLVRADGPMPCHRVARLLVQICGSLGEAHAAGIIHRDLKPENILVVRSQDGRNELVKVCDFGLAKLREAPESNDVTTHGAIVGTPYYMSPEQIRGEDVDSRTDIYALGALIYRLLTGTPPFVGQNPMAVFAKHLTEQAVAPSERMPGSGIPRALDQLVLRALSKHKEDRPGSVEEIQAELMDLLRTGTSSSADLLVDSGQIRSLAREIATVALSDTQVQDGPPVYRQAATRDEVASFERKLARQRRLGQLGAVVGIVALGAVGVRASRLALAPPEFDGREREPNNVAAEANVVPFGSPVRGLLGKRLAQQTSDRDFYAFDIPPGVSHARLHQGALPNFATCTWLYRAGLSDPLARFCSGAALRDLDIPAYRVEPGRYLLAVLQDTDSYGEGVPPPVFENVSDEYTLEFGPVAVDRSREIEPNDTAPQAMRVPLGAEVRGMLAFVRDEDMFCPDEAARGRVRWLIRDAVERPRDPSAVLEVTLTRSAADDPLVVLVHRPNVQGLLTPTNALSPYLSPPASADGALGGCVRLRLAPDPWSGSSPARPPTPGRESYVVRLEAAP